MTIDEKGRINRWDRIKDIPRRTRSQQSRLSEDTTDRFSEDTTELFRKDLALASAFLGIPVGYIIGSFFARLPVMEILFLIATIIIGILVFGLIFSDDDDKGEGWLIFIGILVVLSVLMRVHKTYPSFINALIIALIVAWFFFLLGGSSSLSKELFHYGKEIIHIIWIAAGALSLLTIVFFISLGGSGGTGGGTGVGGGGKPKAKLSSEKIVNEQKASKSTPSRLFVNTEPADCSIRIAYCNRKFHQGIELNPGRYTIEASATGYKTASKRVELSAGENTTIYISMEKNEKTVTDSKYLLERRVNERNKDTHPYEQKQKDEKFSRFFEEIFSNRHSLHFFERGKGMPQKKVYHNYFRQRTAKYVTYELRLKHKPPGQRIEFPIVAVYKRTDGTIFHRSTQNSYVERDWANSYHAHSVGWENPGKWPIDIYTVHIYIKGKEIASESFRILWD